MKIPANRSLKHLFPYALLEAAAYTAASVLNYLSGAENKALFAALTAALMSLLFLLFRELM